jgi:hypothetical protein
MKGFTLVLTACKLILRFASIYYSRHKSAYTTAQQTQLEALFQTATAVIGAIEWPIQ